MRITSWEIDGFGIFHDFLARDLSAGLTIFRGPNEAGKTTLLAFLRGMLFGFPEGDRGRSHYPPLAGGEHGGRITLETGAGSITVERRIGKLVPPRITLADGSRGTESDLRRALGGLSDRLFRSAFAFSLTELQVLESLSAEDVRDHLFSATIAGAGRFARKAVRELEKEAYELLPEKGESRIKTLAGEIGKVRERISRARKALVRYPDLVKRERTSLERSSRIDTRIAGLRTGVEHSERLIEAWPAFSEARQCRLHLESLDAVDEFPANAEARLAAVDEKVGTMRAELDDLRRERARVEQKCADVAARIDARLDDLAGPIGRLYEGLGVHRQFFQQLTDARDRLARLERTLSGHLAAIGPGWNEQELREFDSPARLLEEARDWDRRRNEAREQLEEVRNAFQNQAERVNRLAGRRERIAGDLARSEPPDPGTLEEWEAAGCRLRANFAELRAARAELERTREGIAKTRQALEEMEDPRPRQPGVLVPIAIAIAIAGFLGFLWRANDSDVPGALAFALLAILGGGGGFVLRSFLRQAREREERQREERARREEELEAATTGADRLGNRVRDFLEKLRADSSLIQLRGELSFESVENRILELSRLREARRVWDEKTRELETFDRELERAREEEDRRADRVPREERRLKELESSWRDWKAGSGVDPALDSAQLDAFLRRIAAARESLGEVAAARAERDAAAKKATAWEEEVERILKRGGDPGGTGLTGGALIARFLDLHERSGKDLELRRRLDMLREQLEERTDWIRNRENQLRSAEAERQAILTEAGAADISEFHARLGTHRRRGELKQRLAEAESRLDSQLGRDEDSAGVRAELARGHLETWKRDLVEIQGQIDRLQEERDESIRRHRDAEHERRALEESTELADLELEEQCLLAELETVTNSWRVNRLTSGLLLETLDEFERTRQPRVIAEAADIFRTITVGRYVELRQSDAADDLVAVDSNGDRKPTSTLSRGTAEQLYLSLRLSLVREFARGNLSMPLVMDDVLVNFDPERAESVARALCDLSREHQVLLFTCQPRTAELLRSFAPETAVLDLDRPAPKRKRPRRVG